MGMKNKGDLVINGTGASNGGQFNLVKLNGIGKVNTDLECSGFECNGTGTLKGNLKSIAARVSGTGRFAGTIESEKLTVEGTAKIRQNLFVKKLNISGKVDVEGSVKCEDIQLHGSLIVGKDCDAETLKGKYRLTVGGLLNVGEADLEIYGPCYAKEIGGQTIRIRQHKGSIIGTLFKPLLKTRLETDLIEGDTIELEQTTAKMVRGTHVRIGPNCQLDVVEYTEEFFQDGNAVVGESRKV